MIRKETVGMKNMYFTITGCEHYLGNEFMEKGMKVKNRTMSLIQKRLW